MENENEDAGNKKDRVGSEPCKPTTSVCECPTHFVRGRGRAARSAVVPVRFTPTEQRGLQEEAKAHHISLSAFIRAAALKRRLPVCAVAEVNRTTYEELARIGNNLNQLLRAVNAKMVASVDEALIGRLSFHVRQLALAVLGAEVQA